MFEKKENKKEKEFLALLRKSYNSIKKKDFSEAVALYNKIDSKYKALPLKCKTEKIKQDIQILRSELTLYLRINEAYIHSEEGNMDRLKQELDSIHNSLYDLDATEDTQPLIDYVSNHYKFFLDVYSYKSSQEEFTKRYKRIEKLTENNKVSEARKEFSQLIILSKKLSEYIDEDEQAAQYAKLKGLFREISMKTLITKATRKVHPIKPRKEVLTKVETPPREPEPKSSVSHEFKDEYKELHKLLKKGDLAAAEDLCKRL
jgi:hypothetical protein